MRCYKFLIRRAQCLLNNNSRNILISINCLFTHSLTWTRKLCKHVNHSLSEYWYCTMCSMVLYPQDWDKILHRLAILYLGSSTSLAITFLWNKYLQMFFFQYHSYVLRITLLYKLEDALFMERFPLQTSSDSSRK